MDKNVAKNPLGEEPIGKLMVKFAVPSIVAMLVSALYNIIDQLFIGQAVGTIGNAATNIAFPLSTSCVALALLFGIGGASSFNLAMGRNESDKAAHYVGNSIVLLLGSGIILMLVTQIFLTPMLKFFGSPDDVLEYAKTYVRITSFGFPFLILTAGGGHLIRADGNPKMAMICNLSGAIINTILDAVFVFGFDMGMAGAAYATIIGQIFSGFLVINYMRRYKTVELTTHQLKLKWEYSRRIISLGTASFFNQIAMMVVQIVLNKSLKYYGALSEYGEAIPLACVGIISKINMVFFSFIIGIAQGTQPIEGYCYGAGKYKRVKETYRLAAIVGGIIAIIFFLLFQLAPRQIITLFGKGDARYYEFGISYFRVFLLFTCLNFLQPITSTFFTSIGKPYKGIFLSLTRQILFLLPLIIAMPLFMGIDGILYSGPIADVLAAIITIIMVLAEFRNMKKLQVIENKS
ncbi:Na+-driven multidrug efflux pump [Anaerosporobacter mobilis DSM 15930]|uniref:Multidrug export protein MepA n=1 Tax=Anaerosporobacter mobilis DSM 15930 TaxID=1120996 RepID=A0A1M7GU25_9FIRM|nr:MATE family efflux transporter [Anaerosporobacter mobilis]SHM19675.1 Na+-driven multidrug efflux pump [Anaerosporobacter mobilis DSM 15930]